MLDLAYPLVHLYNSSEPLPPRQLERKVHLCRQLLAIADVLTPGELAVNHGCMFSAAHDAFSARPTAEKCLSGFSKGDCWHKVGIG